MDKHFMNKQHGAHMSGMQEKEPAQDVDEKSGQHKTPHIHIHSHSKGHTVHIMHHSGKHEKHEHEKGDVEGIKSHIDEHMGGEEGQDHGYSSGDLMEDESGDGPGL